MVLAGVPDVDADLLYAAGFAGPDPVAWFRLDGRGYLLVNDLETERARREARADRVLPLSRYGRMAGRGRPPLPHLHQALARALRERGVRRADVPESFPAAAGQALTRAGIRVRIRPAPFFPARLRKSADEIRKMQRAARAAEAGMAAGIQALRECRIGHDGYLRRAGRRLTSESLRDRIDSAIFATGGVPAHTIVAGGVQGADPHARGSGPLRAHHPIVLDLFPRSRSSGYYADMTRTVVKGRADERTRAAFLAVSIAQQLAIQTLQPGVDGAEVHRRVCTFLERAGFPTSVTGGIRRGFFHGTGHGIGLDLHEPPLISRRSCRLEAGQVVTVEPGLYYPDLGGMRIEDVVRITRSGGRKLTRFPVFLEIP